MTQATGLLVFHTCGVARTNHFKSYTTVETYYFYKRNRSILQVQKMFCFWILADINAIQVNKRLRIGLNLKCITYYIALNLRLITHDQF